MNSTAATSTLPRSDVVKETEVAPPLAVNSLEWAESVGWSGGTRHERERERGQRFGKGGSGLTDCLPPSFPARRTPAASASLPDFEGICFRSFGRSFDRISKTQLFAATDPFNRHLLRPSLHLLLLLPSSSVRLETWCVLRIHSLPTLYNMLLP